MKRAPLWHPPAGWVAPAGRHAGPPAWAMEQRKQMKQWAAKAAEVAERDAKAWRAWQEASKDELAKAARKAEAAAERDKAAEAEETKAAAERDKARDIWIKERLAKKATWLGCSKAEQGERLAAAVEERNARIKEINESLLRESDEIAKRRRFG